jgi:hypothetical protein
MAGLLYASPHRGAPLQRRLVRQRFGLLLQGRHKAIAPPPDGAQQGWGAAGIVQRLTHRQDAGVQHGIPHLLPRPQPRQQLLLAHDAVPMCQQIR